MSTFTPTSIRFDPPDAPDFLGGAVLRSLARPQPKFVSWGFLRTLIFGLVTCGLAPLLILSKRLRWYAIGQNANLEYAWRWIGQNLRPQVAEGSLRPPRAPAIGVLVYLAAAVLTVVAIGAILVSTPDITPGDVYRFAFGRVDSAAYRGWLIALSAVYALHFVAVHRCVNMLRIGANRINALIKEQGIQPIARPKLRGGGLFFAWIIAGIVAAAFGAFWAVPMMLAACAQRRYIRHTNKVNRDEVSRVVRELIVRRPAGAARLVVPESLRARCPHADCVGRIRPEAQFCPNCGRRVVGAVAM